MTNSIIDYILPEDMEEYTAIIERAAEAKKNAPKPERKPRGPLTEEQKMSRKQKQIEKLQAELDAYRAAQTAVIDDTQNA